MLTPETCVRFINYFVCACVMYANSRFWSASLTIEGNCFVLRCLLPFKLDNLALIVIIVALLSFSRHFCFGNMWYWRGKITQSVSLPRRLKKLNFLKNMLFACSFIKTVSSSSQMTCPLLLLSYIAFSVCLLVVTVLRDGATITCTLPARCIMHVH